MTFIKENQTHRSKREPRINYFDLRNKLFTSKSDWKWTACSSRDTEALGVATSCKSRLPLSNIIHTFIHLALEISLVSVRQYMLYLFHTNYFEWGIVPRNISPVAETYLHPSSARMNLLLVIPIKFLSLPRRTLKFVFKRNCEHLFRKNDPLIALKQFHKLYSIE